MKKLITFFTLILIANPALSYETQEEIDAITVDDQISFLLSKVYPACKYSFTDPENPAFENVVVETRLQIPIYDEFEVVTETGTSTETILTGYEDGELDPACTPELSILEGRLTQLKQKLTYAFVLKNKKAEARSKFNQIRPYFWRALKKAGLKHIANPEAWIRDNCKKATTHEQLDTCIVRFDSLINQIPSIEAENQAAADKKAAYNQAKTFLKNYDCTSITNNLNKAICIIVKGE